MAPRSLLIAAAIAAMGTTAPVASELCTDDAMLVFDGSGSMAENGFNQLDEPRIFAARRAVRTAIPGIAASRRLGLVIYGPGSAEECGNTALRFAPMWQSAEPIIGEIDTLQPEGGTALTDAVSLAAEVLDHRNQPGVIVLVTDGKETCGGAPCRLASELSAVSVDLTVHVIGFKVRGEFFSWESQGRQEYLEGTTPARCLADITGGKYISTESAEELGDALRDTMGCTLVGTAARPRPSEG